MKPYRIFLVVLASIVLILGSISLFAKIHNFTNTPLDWGVAIILSLAIILLSITITHFLVVTRVGVRVQPHIKGE